MFSSHICSDYGPIPSRSKARNTTKTFLALIFFSLLIFTFLAISVFRTADQPTQLPNRELLTWDPHENKQVENFNLANHGLAKYGVTPATYQQVEEAISAKENALRELESPKNNGDEFPQVWYDPTNPEHNSITHKRLKEMGVDMEAAKVNFDWGNVNGFNALTPVRDQGRTGTCWAFSSKVVSETAWWIAGNDLVELSPQVLADCIDLTCKGEFCNEAKTAAIDSSHTKDVEICQFEDCHFYQFDNFGYCDSAPFPNKGCGVRNGWGGGAQIDAFRYYWHRGFVKLEDYPFRICAGHDWEYRHRDLNADQRKQVCLDQARYCAWDESMTYPFSKCILGLPVSLPCDKNADKIVGKISGAFLVSIANYPQIVQDRINNAEKEIYFQGEAPDITMSEERMKDALLNVGPLAISIVSGPMHYYQGGILDLPDELCGSRGEGDHAVTIVGYGEENGVKYWNIQNSWGDLWGEGGSIRLIRGKNTCGIASDVQAAHV